MATITRRRWMMFVDGENFTFRAQEFAKSQGTALPVGSYYDPDVFAWFNKIHATAFPAKWFFGDDGLTPAALIRAYYYTSVVGDDQRVGTTKPMPR